MRLNRQILSIVETQWTIHSFLSAHADYLRHTTVGQYDSEPAETKISLENQDAAGRA